MSVISRFGRLALEVNQKAAQLSQSGFSSP